MPNAKKGDALARKYLERRLRTLASQKKQDPADVAEVLDDAIDYGLSLALAALRSLPAAERGRANYGHAVSRVSELLLSRLEKRCA